jgi:hypothetical protein
MNVVTAALLSTVMVMESAAGTAATTAAIAAGRKADMTQGLLIRTDGSVTEFEFNELKDYQEKVGGWIEAVRLVGGATGYINEEGKLEGLPMNKVATVLFYAVIRGGAFEAEIPWISPANGGVFDFIAGPMIVVGAADEEGNDTDITPEIRKLVGIARSMV